MTNLKNANLKVPPLKIVLSSATSGGSDRSTSTSPSSESESLDSNLTIISTTETQQERSSSRSDQKDDQAQTRFDKVSRNTAKGTGSSNGGGGGGGGGGVGNNGSCSGNESKVSNSVSGATIVYSSKRIHQDQNCDATLESTASTREPSSSQRITRSSQRAAQQNKSDNCNETNGDDTNLADNQDKSTSETGQRKVKRRKADQTESTSEETNQQMQPQPVVMASICPADYQLPSQNSFELYRDIRNRPHMKMMKLNLIPPRVPHGFRDYIIYGGPYLLEGNKVGLGLSGGRIESPVKTNHGSTCMTTKMKLFSNFQRRLASFNQRHSSYIIPKPLEAPKNLKPGSPLLELFQDQERARQRMRIQHLKERERSVLTCEQEILRAYNQVTIADNQQNLHLSACTYFFYQERYHYVDEENNYLDSINQKDSSQSRENSDSCNAENAIGAGKLQTKSDESQDNVPASSAEAAADNKCRQVDEFKSDKEIANSNSESSTDAESDRKHLPKRRKSEHAVEKVDNISDSKNACDTNSNKMAKSSDEQSTKEVDSRGEKVVENNGSEDNITSNVKPVEKSANRCDTGGNAGGAGNGSSDTKTDEKLAIPNLKEANKSAFLRDLQDIDNKWAKIKNEMFVRHKNESDSLYAVQCLEWEWKAKEVGACDVRLSLRVDPEFVPRVAVTAHDY